MGYYVRAGTVRGSEQAAVLWSLILWILDVIGSHRVRIQNVQNISIHSGNLARENLAGAFPRHPSTITGNGRSPYSLQLRSRSRTAGQELRLLMQERLLNRLGIVRNFC